MDIRYRLLAERAVVALHMHFHAGMNKPGFEECQTDLCGEWHALEKQRLAAASHAKTHCCGCDMPRAECVCDCT